MVAPVWVKVLKVESQFDLEDNCTEVSEAVPAADPANAPAAPELVKCWTGSGAG